MPTFTKHALLFVVLMKCGPYEAKCYGMIHILLESGYGGISKSKCCASERFL